MFNFNIIKSNSEKVLSNLENFELFLRENSTAIHIPLLDKKKFDFHGLEDKEIIIYQPQDERGRAYSNNIAEKIREWRQAGRIKALNSWYPTGKAYSDLLIFLSSRLLTFLTSAKELPFVSVLHCP